MNKGKVDPQKPPIEDVQGHSYQHEIGDPDVQKKIEAVLNKGGSARRLPERNKTTPIEQSEHAVQYQQQRAKKGLPAAVKRPHRSSRREKQS
jgi:hypothetical protein